MSEIINKVAGSGIVSLDPEIFFPTSCVIFDLQPILYEGMILREKDLRDFIALHDWTAYRGQHVALFCSSDAIVPAWAWMLIASALEPYAATVFTGTLEQMQEYLMLQQVACLATDTYRDARVVVKGCGDKHIPQSVYTALTIRLRPVVKSLMYGEPCSTVPVFKRT